MYWIKIAENKLGLVEIKILTKCIYWLTYCRFFRKILSQCTYSYFPICFS